ncbi:hypothetical protein [Massilia niastensis]|nr:hypothetical protein [Massilia niastensis]
MNAALRAWGVVAALAVAMLWGCWRLLRPEAWMALLGALSVC